MVNNIDLREMNRIVVTAWQDAIEPHTDSDLETTYDRTSTGLFQRFRFDSSRPRRFEQAG
jgi:hypothetical protein